MATTAEHPYEEFLDSLARSIRRLRSDCPPWEVAREILTYDNPGHTHVVGIDRWGERATFYHCKDHYAIAVEFDADGLAEGGPSVARFKRGAQDVQSQLHHQFIEQPHVVEQHGKAEGEEPTTNHSKRSTKDRHRTD